MTDLQVRVELEKLGAELGCQPEDLTWLSDLGVSDLRELRSLISDSLFARHEKAFAPLAALSRMVPTRLAVKIAEHALGPLVAARIAGAVDTKYAAAMASAMSPNFLADVAVLIDPVRVRELLPLVPQELVVEVGRRMLASGHHLALSRFVPVVSTADALAVVDSAKPDQTLTVALYCEDPAALGDIIEAIDERALLEIVDHAATSGHVDDALTLIDAISGSPRERLLSLSSQVSTEARSALLEAAERQGMADLVASLSR